MLDMGRKIPNDDPVDRARALIAEKDRIEELLKELQQSLDAHKVGITEELVDAMGFPRSDVDVYAVRQIRSEIAKLQTDLKAVYVEIENSLLQVHAHHKQTGAVVASAPLPRAAPSNLVPFARVDGVAPGSPASTAGLLRNDLIVKFASITASNHNNLQSLASTVARYENLNLEIRIIRDNSPMLLNLVPCKWNGRGLLGCHLIPYSGIS